jgi:hypothetical protein
MKIRGTKLSEEPIPRYAFGVIALLSITASVRTLLKGHLHFQNGWGEAVFAPFCTFIGLLALIGVFMPRKKNN